MKTIQKQELHTPQPTTRMKNDGSTKSSLAFTHLEAPTDKKELLAVDPARRRYSSLATLANDTNGLTLVTAAVMRPNPTERVTIPFLLHHHRRYHHKYEEDKITRLHLYTTTTTTTADITISTSRMK